VPLPGCRNAERTGSDSAYALRLPHSGVPPTAVPQLHTPASSVSGAAANQPRPARPLPGCSKKTSSACNHRQHFPAPLEHILQEPPYQGVWHKPASTFQQRRPNEMAFAPSMAGTPCSRGSPVSQSPADTPPRPSPVNRCVLTTLIPLLAREIHIRNRGHARSSGLISPHWSASHPRKCSTSRPPSVRTAFS